MSNAFFKDPEEYQRDLDVVAGYIDHGAHYLHLRSGIPYEECVELVKQEIISEDFQGNDPQTLTLERDKRGDRHVINPTFTSYIQHVQAGGYLLSPTMAVYLPAQKKESLLSNYLIKKGEDRDKAKKTMFVAQQSGDKVTAQNKNVEQTSLKTSYNSLSGAHSSKSTPLFNRSTHSSLTSSCRAATSYANANNEKFLAGNRHYFSKDVVIENMMSICRQADMNKIEQACQHYGLVYPTPEDVVACVKHSSDLYWSKGTAIPEIEQLAACMEPVERAAFLYVSDLYHLAQLNPTFVRQFLLGLSEKIDGSNMDIDTATKIVSDADEPMVMLASLINSDKLKGVHLAAALNPKGDKYSPEIVKALGATLNNILKVIESNELLIEAFWVTDCMPPEIHSVPSILRRTAVLSDTDSTIFTVQYWAEFVFGSTDINDRSLQMSYGVVYLCSQLIIHILAIFSRNMGIEDKYLYKLAMKNEFFYPVLSLTSRSKHYFAYISAQEGNVMPNYKLEMKGVGLRDSNCPPELMTKFVDLIKGIMEKIISDGKFSITETLHHVADIEMGILDALGNGDVRYLKSSKIKRFESYNSENPPALRHNRFYKEVLEPIYGPAPDLPYDAVKIPVDLDSPTRFKEWVESIEDPATQKRVAAWAKAEGVKGMTNFQLPIGVVVSSGIPKEILPVAQLRKVIAESMGPYYIALESFGVFMGDPTHERLVHDMVTDGSVNVA